MDRDSDIIKSIEYIETHLTDNIDCKDVASNIYASAYHFQRIFGMVCGINVADYIRRRRLSLAAIDILDGAKIIDVAFKYGYGSPESFARAFMRFHGVLPSEITKESVKFYPRICPRGDNVMDIKFRNLPETVFVGYKSRFTGVPYGEMRKNQEEKFFCSTRGKQWLLIGASNEPSIDYCIVDNVGEDGYDFYIAYKLGESVRKDIFDPAVSGIDVSKMDLKILNVPRSRYAYFKTDRSKDPLTEFFELRKNVALSGKLTILNAPEITAIHWRDYKRKNFAENRYIELFIPIEDNSKEIK